MMVPKVIIGVLAFFAFSTLGFCQDDGACYTLLNSTTHVVVVNFQYPGGVIPEGGVISATFQPGAQKKYCFQDTSATANIATSDASWEGNRPMVMGDTFGSLPAGTYKMIGGPPAPSLSTPDSPIIWIVNGIGHAFINTSTNDPRAHPITSCPASPVGLNPGIFYVFSARTDNPPHDLQRETNSNELTQISQRGLGQEKVEIGQYLDGCYYIKVSGGCAYIQENSWRNSGPGPLQLGIQPIGRCDNVGGNNGNDEWVVKRNNDGTYVFQSKRSSFCLDRRSQDDGQVKGTVQQNFCNGTDYQNWKLDRIADLPSTSVDANPEFISYYQTVSFASKIGIGPQGPTIHCLMAGGGDLFFINPDDGGSTAMHVLSAASNYQKISFASKIGIGAQGPTIRFLMADNGDLFLINPDDNGSTAIHVLSAASNYQTVSFASKIGIGPQGPTIRFMLASNRDLFLVNPNDNGPGTVAATAIHVLSAVSSYQTVSFANKIGIGPQGPTIHFLLASNGDLFLVNPNDNGPGTVAATAIHVLAH